MEILKKKIEEYKRNCGFKDFNPFINVALLNQWLKEFEERQKHKSKIDWEKQYIIACADFFKLQREKDDWEKRHQEWIEDYNYQLEKAAKLEKENTHLKTCLDKNIQDACLWEKRYDEAINTQKIWENKFKLAEARIDCLCKSLESLEEESADLRKGLGFLKYCNDASPWISIDHPPTHENIVFLIHSGLPDIIHQAYYDEELKEFVSIDTPRTMMICATHWMQRPKLSDNS